MEKTVWAFDLGIASIGEAVRKGNQFLHKASLLIPPEFASTKDAAQRRRAGVNEKSNNNEFEN